MKGPKYVVLRVALRDWTLYHLPMEKRLTILEVLTEQNQKSIDRLDRSLERLDRSIADLRTDVDRKFNWIIGVQVGSLLAMIGFMAKLARFFWVHTWKNASQS